MTKEKYCLEYMFDKVSRQSLWRNISTSAGLSEWFAEEVEITGDRCVFSWSNKHRDEAKILRSVEGERIRFHWLQDEDAKSYFEFSIHESELTGGKSLEIIDFAKKGDRDDAVDFWNTLVERLQHSLGVL